MSPPLPPVVAPEALAGRLGEASLLVVDLSKPEHYARGHLPGAVHLEYAALVAARAPVGGLLPEPERLAAVLGGIGIGEDVEVVACDDEGGGRAGRLIWTLHALGHRRAALLDGGIQGWAGAGLELEAEPRRAAPRAFVPRPDPAVVADCDYILGRLGAPDFVTLDTRSAGEYRGEDRRAARGGHIPGAIHFDWVEALDREHHLRLRPLEGLRERLAAAGVLPEREVVVYCQTHHRSSHTYVLLRHLGYPRVRGYPGAWSDWGNREDTPVESGG